MRNTGNSPKIVPRRQSSTDSLRPVEAAYDCSDVPVLIRLPDLSAVPAPKPIPMETTDQSPAIPGAERDGRKRRIDKRHGRGRPLQKRQRSPLDGIPRSRVGIAAAVLVTAGATYFFMPSGGREQSQEAQHSGEPWSIEERVSEHSVPGAEQSAGDAYATSDLWSQPAPSSLQPPRDLEPAETIAQQQRQQWATQGVSLAEQQTVPSGFNEVTPVGSEVAPGVSSEQSSWPTFEDSRPAANSQPPAEQPSPAGYPPGTRTGMRPADTSVGVPYSGPPSGARLDGVRAPNPTTDNYRR